ncbi:hypothetical protein E2C01_075662 [Portunus trituberculatus]|uniref:Uncharacterized protein n=1 Tax=Portunus trituberculatus TaxID=210409 RepID=A0A5B7IB97_PORTR|nr:hypothetical protein [Portunus trituberculatus]
MQPARHSRGQATPRGWAATPPMQALDCLRTVVQKNNNTKEGQGERTGGEGGCLVPPGAQGGDLEASPTPSPPYSDTIVHFQPFTPTRSQR